MIKNIKHKIIRNFLFVFVFANCELQIANCQQDPQFSNYMFNQLTLNPAYAGSRDVLDAVMLYRNQWTGIQGAPKTESFAIHAPWKRKKIGVGLQVQAEQIGPKDIMSFLGSYSYALRITDDSWLYMGARGGMYSYVFNWDEITYFNKTDAMVLTGTTQKLVPDADAGLYFTAPKWNLGLSVTHILAKALRSSDPATDAQMGELEPHFLLFGGYSIVLSDELVFNPSALIRYNKNSPVAADLNLNFLLSKILWLGISVRKGSGLVFLTKYNINNHFKIGYAFDLGINDIGLAGKGSHEIMLQYNLFVGKPTKKARPRF